MASLHSHTARPLRRLRGQSHYRSILRRLAMLESVLAFVCRVLARRIPQVGP